jgi:hypothetical protein
MAPQEGNGRQRFGSFADYAAAVGHVSTEAPSGLRKMAGYAEFYDLAILPKLWKTGTKQEGVSPQERREWVANAVADTLRIGPGARAEQGLQVVSIGPKAVDGSLLQQDHALVGVIVQVLFPTPSGKPRLVQSSDSALFQYEKITRAELLASSDVFHEETGAERINRLVLSLKSLDNQIFQQKDYVRGRHLPKIGDPLRKKISTRSATQEMDRLNRLKTIAVQDFLVTARAVEAAHPELQPLFVIAESDVDSIHATLRMWAVDDGNVLERAIDRSKAEVLGDSQREFTTSINLQSLREVRDQYLDDPTAASEYIRAGYETSILLDQLDLTQRKRVVKAIPVVEAVVPIDERREDLVKFAQLPIEVQLRQALNEHIGASRRGHPKAHAEALEKRHVAIKSALSASEDQRRARGIHVLVIAPLTTAGDLEVADTDYTEYRVITAFKAGGKRKFLDATRRNLANPQNPEGNVSTDQLAAVDVLVEGANRFYEEPVDGYKRTIAELNVIDQDLRQLYKLRGKPVSPKGINEQITGLLAKKDTALLSYLEFADLAVGTHPDLHPLYIVEEQERNGDTYAEFTLHDVKFTDTVGYFLGNSDRGVAKDTSLRTRILLPALKRHATAYELGDESEANGVSMLILERLNAMGIGNQE